MITKLDKQSINLNLRSLDTLRGLLATYVLLGHCRWLLWAGNGEWSKYSHSWWANILASTSASLRYGHEAVMVFFVLSGFFIHLRVSQQLAKSPNFEFNVTNFFQRRSYRLIPPYLFALALTVFVDLLGRYLYPTLYNGLTGDSLLDYNFHRKEFSLASVLPALLMLPSSLGKDFGSNGPLWSLGYEVIYYLLYPVWLNLRKLGALPAYFIGMALTILVGFSINIAFVSQVLIHYPIWLTGAAIAELLVTKTFPKLSIIANSLLLIIAFLGTQLTQGMPIKIMFDALLGLSVVIMTVGLPLSITSNNMHKFFESIGISSYSIYICHFPVVTFISAWYIELFNSRPMHGWLAVCGAVSTLLTTHICFRVCERHFLHSRLRVK